MGCGGSKPYYDVTEDSMKMDTTFNGGTPYTWGDATKDTKLPLSPPSDYTDATAELH